MKKKSNTAVDGDRQRNAEGRIGLFGVVVMAIALAGGCAGDGGKTDAGIRDEDAQKLAQMKEALDATAREGAGANAVGLKPPPLLSKRGAIPAGANGAIKKDDGEKVAPESGAETKAPTEVLKRDDVAGPTLEEQRRRLAGELGAVLRSEAAKSGSPTAAMTRLAALDIIEPGTAMGAGAGGKPELSSREAEFMSAWGALCADAGSSLAGGGAGGGTEPVKRAVISAAERFESSLGLSIAHSALCSRVETFGVYDELHTVGGTYKFIAGRKNRAVVYIELDRFASRRGSRDGVDGWRVELVQDLSLYAYRSGDVSDMLAWRKADQPVSDFSRNRRRDFFVVQMIELPETLTVGSYRLKVTVRDRVEGMTAEAIIPIDVVVDGSAVKR
ncbi:MAG TPA: hypothetical protein VG797_09995 [Phycisphaerales bacterium]|nr:hypothetical protein [Phycisphaerales bacterium]